MRRTALLVEDEADARASLVRSLERGGFECVEAATPAEALAAAARGPGIDVCVIDVVLGQEDNAGLDLVGPLRRSTGAPIIVVTAFANVDRVKKALNDGAAYFIEKPFAARDLLEAMGRVLSEATEVARLVNRALAMAGLTDKEEAVARLLLKGLPTAEIARLEGNSDKTVRQHISQVYAKLGVSSRAEFFNHVFPF